MKVLYLTIIYLLVALLMSVVTFVAYGIDKRRARTGGRRISEATLHWLELFGGWPGALAAQRLFRHKTQKLNYRLVFWSIVALHLSILTVLAFVWLRP